MQQYFNYNGEYIEVEKPVFGTSSPFFASSEFLREEIFVSGKGIFFFDKYMLKLRQAMHLLGWPVLAKFDQERSAFELEIDRLLHRNRLYQGVNVRLTVFPEIKDGRLTTSYILQTIKLPYSRYYLNEKGLRLDVFSTMPKLRSHLSGWRSPFELVYSAADRQCKRKLYDECILLNESGFVTETNHYNIFIVKEQTLYTPALSEGAYNGVIRDVIAEIAPKIGCEVKEIVNFVPDNLIKVEEVLLADMVNGVKWVLGFKEKRYFNRNGANLVKALNDLMGI